MTKSKSSPSQPCHQSSSPQNLCTCKCEPLNLVIKMTLFKLRPSHSQCQVAKDVQNNDHTIRASLVSLPLPLAHVDDAPDNDASPLKYSTPSRWQSSTHGVHSHLCFLFLAFAGTSNHQFAFTRRRQAAGLSRSIGRSAAAIPVSGATFSNSTDVKGITVKCFLPSTDRTAKRRRTGSTLTGQAGYANLCR